MLSPNMVLQYESGIAQQESEDNEDKQKNANNAFKLIRVISVLGKRTFYVDMVSTGSMPKVIKTEELERAIANQLVVKAKDPYLTFIHENDIPDKHKDIRDRNWEIVNFIWTNKKSELLSSNSIRGKCIRSVSLELSVPEITVRKLLKRFWQRGMSKNCMLPDFDHCGMKGTLKPVGSAKRGRPRNPDSNGNDVEGINITEGIRGFIAISINEEYRKNRKSLKEAYEYMKQRYFSDITFLNGEPIIRIWDDGRIPRYETFLYWFHKEEEDIEKDIIFREGKNQFNLLNRQLLSNSTLETFGPGSKYQIDATIADVYLVSSKNRSKIIGRPVVYVAIDVYSRLVTGIYVGLEGPSWLGATMLINNIVESKVEYCNKFGIKIKHEDWPCEYLPHVILADRGEFEGKCAENLIDNLGIRIENTPPYRGDLKGIVERYFRTLNEKVRHLSPGAILKEFKRRDGSPDYRLDAKLDLHEFTALIINCVLKHNKTIIQKYPKESGLIADGIPKIPVELWQWGIQNRLGGFVYREPDIVRLNLLPRIKASVTRQGIKIKTQYYSSEVCIREKWFINPVHKTIEVVHDPRDINYIYIPIKKGEDFIKCHLLEKSFAYKDLYFEEVVFHQELEAEQERGQTNKQNQIVADFNTDVQKVIDDAIEKTERQLINQSNRSRIAGIRTNRAEEKEWIREQESFELGKKELKNGQLVQISKPKTLESNPDLEALKRRRANNGGR